jgi:hypothetical protein
LQKYEAKRSRATTFAAPKWKSDRNKGSKRINPILLSQYGKNSQFDYALKIV